jgi:hypothetical protein
MVRRSKTLLLGSSFVTPWRVWCLSLSVPRPRSGNATRLSHRHGLGSSRFARRYSGSRCCFLFLGVLRCFNSPGSLYRSYVFRPEYRSHAAVGFPIRTSTDQSLVGSSPWLIAATHVLHRLQAPRHPPLALCSLKKQRCSCSLWNSQGATNPPVAKATGCPHRQEVAHDGGQLPGPQGKRPTPFGVGVRLRYRSDAPCKRNRVGPTGPAPALRG